MNVCILGITGSIGQNAVEVCKQLGYKIVAATIKSNYALLGSIIEDYDLLPSLKYVGVNDNLSGEKFQLLASNWDLKVYKGIDANLSCIKEEKYDIIINALVGSDGIEPSYYALDNCNRLALANKESIVAAGELLLQKAKERNCQIIPIDSEHSAILQCLEDNPIKKIYLTASGGPFWSLSWEDLKKVTLEQALKHPNWDMGKKITIDSATMMNKGFELIEASILYHMSYDKIDVLIHPQSIVHSLVEYEDLSVKAQLSACDMRISIQYALTYPKRYENSFEALDLTKYQLSFFKPDFEKFKCLELAYRVVKEKGSLGVVINGANDVCVDLFLKKKINFLDIGYIIEKVMDQHTKTNPKSIEEILEIDRWAKEKALSVEVNWWEHF